MGNKEFKRFMAMLLFGIPILIALCLYQGCASMKCEPYGKTIWKSGDHAYFSIWGHKNPTFNDWMKSQTERWNGCEVKLKK